MADKKRKNKNFGKQPFEFYCKYAMRYVIRGGYNHTCRCAHCSIDSICDSCLIKYDACETQRRITQCTECRIKTNQIRRRIATEKQQKQK